MDRINPGMKRNYDREMEDEIALLQGKRPTLLLHSCCGPCSSAVLERLREHFQVTVLYYNPNIEPEEEYLHRRAEQQRLLSLLGDEIGWLPCDYDHDAFTSFAQHMADEPEGGKRCLACFALRLNETAAQAKARKRLESETWAEKARQFEAYIMQETPENRETTETPETGLPQNEIKSEK